MINASHLLSSFNINIVMNYCNDEKASVFTLNLSMDIYTIKTKARVCLFNLRFCSTAIALMPSEILITFHFQFLIPSGF